MRVFDLRGTALVALFEQEVANEVPDVGRFDMPMELRPRTSRTVVRFSRPSGATLDEASWAPLDVIDEPDYNRALLPWRSRTRIDWEMRDDGQWAVVESDP